MSRALVTRSPSVISISSRRARSGPARRSGWWSTRIWCSLQREGTDMADLKLGKLPDRTPVKLAVTLPPDLHQALQAYAGAYEQAYGIAEPLGELIPAMPAAFLESEDRKSTRLNSSH